MLDLQELLTELDYYKSPYYRRQESEFEPETVHLFRVAQEINKSDEINGEIDGVYVIETSPKDTQAILPAQPVVYIATAETEDAAREIHRNLWNLCYAPFLIIKLPHQIRIYTGFNYSAEKENVGLLVDPIDTLARLTILQSFSSLAIDSKQIWQSPYGKQLNPNQRVDKRLLQNLQQLGNLLKEYGLNTDTAHSLIGKYVYISYLRDRDILSDKWLDEQSIDPEDIFSYRATVASLRRLTEAIETRFNGQIFPLDFDSDDSLRDDHVSWIASVFRGDNIKETPEIVRQYYLPFRAYNFKYIPVETLSSIYEQFIYDRKQKGAIYTPEVVADYLLSEMEWAKPLERGMRILDPACGSGVFLVLAYRRLIEKELRKKGRKLSSEELRDILMESIYGIEKELDACFVTEFSLLLTLLHYIEPRELHRNLRIQFPALHNKRIFHGDFFDNEIPLITRRLKFDYVIGNPPWIKADNIEQSHASQWISDNKTEHPVGNKSIAEAFSWRVGMFLNEEGLIGLLMPATSLVNLKSTIYRQQIFSNYEFIRITNFANLREILFDKRGTLPAATFIYQKRNLLDQRYSIIHYGPFSANQVIGEQKRPWVITINENEIQTIDSKEAVRGKTETWKFALWGTRHDRRALDRISYLFPTTLEEFCETRNWGRKLPQQGAELRTKTQSKEKVEYLSDLKNTKQFSTDLYNQLKIKRRFSIIPEMLKSNSRYYLRSRGGKAGLRINAAPHIILSKGWRFIIYSEKDFIIPPQQMGICISKDNPDDITYLKSIASFLNSSLVSYYLFFHVPEWGFFRQRRSVITTEVRQIPIPNISPKQAEELADFYDNLASIEEIEIQNLTTHIQSSRQNLLSDGSRPGDISIEGLKSLSTSEIKLVKNFSTDLDLRLQNLLDSKVQEVLNLPDDLFMISKEFVNLKLTLDTPSAIKKITVPAGTDVLLGYADQLRDELDSFTMSTTHHQITITYSDDLVECKVEITNQPQPFLITEENIQPSDTDSLSGLRDSLQEQISQWVYIQQGLRLFDGPYIYIYKPNRLIDWTRIQAMQDASDIISSVLTSE